MRYELADYEWVAIKPMLPNKPCGVPRVNDRRVLNEGGGLTLIRATVTRQGVCALHAAMMVSFDRPKLSLGALVLIPIGRAADGLHWITYVVDADHVLR
jgi:hypothetical protein